MPEVQLIFQVITFQLWQRICAVTLMLLVFMGDGKGLPSGDLSVRLTTYFTFQCLLNCESRDYIDVYEYKCTYNIIVSICRSQVPPYRTTKGRTLTLDRSIKTVGAQYLIVQCQSIPENSRVNHLLHSHAHTHRRRGASACRYTNCIHTQTLYLHYRHVYV